jgi:hypothetical protein
MLDSKITSVVALTIRNVPVPVSLEGVVSGKSVIFTNVVTPLTVIKKKLEDSVPGLIAFLNLIEVSPLNTLIVFKVGSSLLCSFTDNNALVIELFLDKMALINVE